MIVLGLDEIDAKSRLNKVYLPFSHTLQYFAL